VTTATTNALLVVFAPREVDPLRMADVIERTSARMQEFTGCREVNRTIV